MNSVREGSGPITAGTGGGHGAGRAHGKAILLGEHTVVHGTPALAFPLPTLSARAVARLGRPEDEGDSLAVQHFRFVAGDTVTASSGAHVAVEEALRRWGLAGEVVEVVLDCEIPPARGLGSSAACAAAAVRAVADLYGRTIGSDALYELVQCGEQFAHGRASGVDASAAVATGPIRFQAGTARELAVGLDATLVVADTGTAGATQHAVAAVRRKLDADRRAADRLLERAANLVESAAADLAAGSVESLGETLLEFQSLLAELGVSTPEIDTLVTAASGAGAYGAKLTGGGLGGCVLALTETGDGAASVRAALHRAGAVRTWIVPTRAAQP
ncbi:mevalonate kinase [Nocardia amikacinitolerans]|uniref:mevalonate kinase n=1 Tax=Nocardia amikacinitolerans TaxID=756689 RepID=UPI0020A255E9|nr:mevalonate kinase [Nocardia amikacinitolerans]MCP2279304.1 mevalonate kinase [Nocardia amikacinitolerans]